LHRGTGRFGVKSVVKNANEILQGALLGLEAAWGISERSFNMGENPGTPGMSGSSPSKNDGGDAFLSEGIVLVVDWVRKVSG